MSQRTYFSGLVASSALVLSACTGGTGGGGITIGTDPPPAQGDQLVIQPIQVCNDSGGQCAQTGFFEAVTQKIWDQAGLQVTFLPTNQLNDSTYLSVAPGAGSNSEFSQLSFSGGAGAFGRHPSSTRDSGPINLWFVDTIEVGSGLVQFGNAWVGSNGVLISDDIFDFNNGVGRIDVIAHEVGHNLGLRHSTLGAGPANNLMSDGRSRAIPSSIDDIYPDGARLSRLNDDQIREARSSGFLLSAAGLASLTGSMPDVAESDIPTGLTTEADAIPVGFEASVSGLKVPKDLVTGFSFGVGDAAWPPLATSGSSAEPAGGYTSIEPSIELVAEADTASVPEPGVSFLVWLGLAGFGGRCLQKGRSQLSSSRTKLSRVGSDCQ
ncbi:MAG: zinc-dependent metalloprotease family protein [Cyanobacteria bacterium P01_A01_bin.114]